MSPSGPGKGTSLLSSPLHLMPVVQEGERLPWHFWEQNLMGWMQNVSPSTTQHLSAAWWALPALSPSIPTHRGWAITGRAPHTPRLHPGPSHPLSRQHVPASAPRGRASQTCFLISFLPPPLQCPDSAGDPSHGGWHWMACSSPAHPS